MSDSDKKYKYISVYIYIYICVYITCIMLSILYWGCNMASPGGSMSYVVGLPNNSYKPITNMAWVRTRLVNYKKGALDSQPQVIKFTSCLPMIGGSL